LNFLLHRHFALRELGSEAAAIGAMLPDLWRMADRRVRARRSVEPVDEASLGELLEGIEHHHAADLWFHKNEVFLEGEQRTTAALREAGASAARLGLFGHVAWEMCLDGALVRREGLARLLSALRPGLARTEGARARAAELHHFERREHAAEDRAAFEARLARLCAEVARGPWIEGYQHGEGITDRLSGVRARLGLPPIVGDDRERVAVALEPLCQDAERALVALEVARGVPSRAAAVTRAR
jgi:hypothetical protein